MQVGLLFQWYWPEVSKMIHMLHVWQRLSGLRCLKDILRHLPDQILVAKLQDRG